MSMRVCSIVTHLRADEALTLIEFLDQLRDVLMHTLWRRGEGNAATGVAAGARGSG